MSFRYERRLPGIGPVRKSTGLTEPAEIEEFKGLVRTLAKERPALLQMWVKDEMTATQLLIANREQRLSEFRKDPRILVTLEEAFERAMGSREGETAKRYRVSMAKFRRLVPDVVSVKDLRTVDYGHLAKTWPGTPSDYMAFRRMMSHFLVKHFGGGLVGKLNRWRAKTMDMIPRKKERKRVPAISPAVFNRLVSLTPDYAQPVYRALLITGFRVRSEFLALKREHLRPQVYEIDVPGTKTPESEAEGMPIDPANWQWIELAVPSPIAYGQIRKHWMRACLAEGLATKKPDPTGRLSKETGQVRLKYCGPTIHDIRHLTGQFMTNEGVPDSMIQAYLRHSDPATTRRYTIQAMRAEAAAAMARVSA